MGWGVGVGVEGRVRGGGEVLSLTHIGGCFSPSRACVHIWLSATASVQGFDPYTY